MSKHSIALFIAVMSTVAIFVASDWMVREVVSSEAVSKAVHTLVQTVISPTLPPAMVDLI